MACNGRRYWHMPPSVLRNGGVIGVTGEMTGKMREILGKRAVRQPGRRSRNARKQMIKVIGTVGRKSEMPRTKHATPPGT